MKPRSLFLGLLCGMITGHGSRPRTAVLGEEGRCRVSGRTLLALSPSSSVVYGGGSCNELFTGSCGFHSSSQVLMPFFSWVLWYSCSPEWLLQETDK